MGVFFLFRDFASLVFPSKGTIIMDALQQFTFDLALERQFNLSETFFDRMSMGLAVFDQDFVLRHCNPTWSDLISRYAPVSASQLRPGIKLFDLIPGAETTFKPLFEQVMLGETIRRGALRLESEAFVSYWDLALTPLIEEEVVNLVVVMTDVTERVLAYQELENQAMAHAHGLAMLLEILHHLVSLEQEPQLLLILDRLEDIVDYIEAGIARLENDQLTVLAYRGFVSQEEWVGWSISVPDSPLLRQVIYHREPVIIPDIWGDSLMAQTLQSVIGEKSLEKAYEMLHSWMAVPLVAKEQVIGMLFLGHREPDHFSAQRVELVQALADHVVVALEIDRLSRQALNLATLEERDRLARELHDNVAQALGYMNLQITATGKLLTTDQTTEVLASLRELKQIVGETYTDVREEIFNLRATTSLGLGFLDTLRDYLARYRTYYELDVQMVMEAEKSLLELPAEVGTQIIRIIQEALINVRKHAGVDKAIIRLKREAERIRISVEDEGQGFDPAQLDQTDNSGFGLQIMAERAEGVGGRLEVDTAPGEGVRVLIWMPVTSGK
jgi:signal transduction histidine kinase